MGSLWMISKRVMAGVLIGVAISDELFSVAQMQGRSMEPTLRPGESGSDADIVLLNRFVAHDFAFSRGDVVLIRSPYEPQSWMVKRLIALEGDTVRVPGIGDKLVQIPQGMCWVEGDNPFFSLDSRDMGPIPIALLKGRVSRVVWPPARFSKVETVPPAGRIVQMNKA